MLPRALRCRPLLALALLVAAGCGLGSNRTYPVKGQVLFKDTGKPMTSGTVMFQSLADPNQLASGEIESDGSFEMYANNGGRGAVAGEHRVIIQPPRPEYAGDKSGAIGPSYQNFDKTTLRFTVKSGDNFCKLEVERPGR